MGDITLDEMREDIKISMHGRDDFAVSDSILTRHINDIYLQLSQPGILFHEELQETIDITLVEDQAIYDLSTTAAWVTTKILQVDSVSYEDGDGTDLFSNSYKRKLDPRNTREFDRVIHTRGAPAQYATREEKLYVWQGVPGSVEAGNIVRLRVVSEPAKLSGDSDVTVFPNYFDRPLVAGATGRVMQILGHTEESVMFFQEQAALINDITSKSELQADDPGADPRMQIGSYVSSSTNNR